MKPLFPNFPSTSRLDTSALFLERRRYDNFSQGAFTAMAHDTGGVNPNTLDFWHNVPYYGKVAPTGELVVPNMSSMKLAAGSNTMTAPKWVFDAASDLQSFLVRSVNQRKNSLDTLFGNFKFVKSYESPQLLYTEHVVGLLGGFNRVILTNPRYKKNLYTFKDWLDKLTIYIGGTGMPFTFSNFFASSKVGAASTGLALQFQTADANNDAQKNKFFAHTDFAKYVQIAANHGFRVNKNAPWVLIADLNSKAFRPYLYNYNLGEASDLFAEHYTPAIWYDVGFTMHLLYDSYNDYQTNRPVMVDYDICTDASFTWKQGMGLNVSYKEQFLRPLESLSQDEFEATYDLETSAKVIERIKRQEYSGRLKPAVYHQFKKRFERFLKKGAVDTAMKHMAHFYNPARIYRHQLIDTPYYLSDFFEGF